MRQANEKKLFTILLTILMPFVFTGTVVAAPNGEVDSLSPRKRQIKLILKSRAVQRQHGLNITETKDVERFYEVTNYLSAWSEDDKVFTSQLNDLVHVIEDTPLEGLNPSAYQKEVLLTLIDRAKNQQTDANLAALDVFATDVFFRLASDFAIGHADPTRVQSDWHYKPQNFVFRCSWDLFAPLARFPCV